MDPTEYQRLSERGQIVPDGSGAESVRVYLQMVPDVPGDTRDERRSALHAYFDELARRRAHTGLELKPDTLSVSGQMIEALLPLATYDTALDELQGEDVKVDLAEALDATL